MKRAALAAALVTAGLGVASCGGETVESTEVTSSTTATTTTSASTSSSPSATTTATTATTTATQTSAAPPAADEPAREVTSAPADLSYLSNKEQAFLGEVRDKGVNVDGIEDVLTATGYSICDGTTVTRDAVAGQLGEQGRTTLDPAAAAQLLDATARAHLC